MFKSERLKMYLLLTGLVLTLSVEAHSQHLKLALDEIAQNADIIFVGTVASQSSRVNDAQTMIFTDVVFKDVRVVHATGKSVQKGRPEIRLTYAGGQAGGATVEVTHTPKLSVGGRYLIFMVDDGSTYASPIVGGEQGMFEVLQDPATREEYLRTVGGRVVSGVGDEGIVLGPRSAAGEPSAAAPTAARFDAPPTPHNPRDSSSASDVGAAAGVSLSGPMRLQDFINILTGVTLKKPLRNDRLKGGGRFYKRDGDKIISEPLGSQSRAPKRLPLMGGGLAAGPPELFQRNNAGLALGGTLGACGYHTLTLNMEQVPSTFWSHSIVNDNLWTWNRFMDMFRVLASDGTWGDNSTNEFGAFADSASLNQVYGFSWPPGALAVTVTKRGLFEPTCGRIAQADVLWNPSFSWTTDADFALGNGGVVLLRSVNQHETGHVWGYQLGSFAETYDYDVASVMQPYYSTVVEDGWGIHATDAYLIRRQYQNQTGIMPTKDVGVESYYALGGLRNSQTNATSYAAGQSITLNNVTVENMSYGAVSDLRIRFYLSTNRAISTSDYQLGGANAYWFWTTFNGETYNVSNYTTTIPATMPPGQYYVGAIVTVNGFGADDYQFNNSTSFYVGPITVRSATPTQPNLTPYQPANWADKIVVSNVPGTSTDAATLRTTDTLRVDWAVINNGAGPTAATFHTKLFVDGVERASWFTDPPLSEGFYAFVQDYSLGSLSAGTHTLRIVADANGVIAEGNESDNAYTKTINVVAPVACYTLTTNVGPAGGGTITRNTPNNCASGVAALAEEVAPDAAAAPARVGSDSGVVRGAATEEAFRALEAKARQGGPVRVIVGLDVDTEPEGTLTSASLLKSQRGRIAKAQDDLLGRLATLDVRPVRKYPYIPFVVVDAGPEGLAHLQNSPEVLSVEEDREFTAALAESVPLIGGPAAWAAGYSGAGQTIAILDTGVDKTHPFLAGKVVAEACFSTTDVSKTSLCPGGVAQSTAPGSGVNCDPATNADCKHGTHVAGIAAGKGGSFSGVAKDANIIAIQVFSRPSAGGRLTWTVNDLLAGLQHVQTLSSSFNIAAVNLSLGGGVSPGYCDSISPSLRTAIENLHSLRIATVVASGNDSNSNGIGFPACISKAVSVGSTDDGSNSSVNDRVSSFSNSASILSLLAPGFWITSSVPGGGYEGNAGTSMAAPHVAGAWAVLKSKSPSATVDQVLSAFTSTGLSITDPRNLLTKPRIKVDAALNALTGGAAGQYSAGTVVSLTAVPTAGYRFQSWSGCDSVVGGNCNVTMSASRAVTANFTQTRVLTVASSNPNSGLSVTVTPADNGGLGGGATQFTRTYDNNAVVTLTAPATAGGGAFQRWRRDGLDFSTARTVNVTMDANRTLTAVYEVTPIQVTVQSNPAGRSITIDGVALTAPQTLSWTPGSAHTIGTTSPQNAATGTRYVWSSWSDGGAVSHAVSPTVAITYTANFTAQHFLTMNAGAGGTVNPASGWFNAGQVVSVSATPSAGFTFGGWTGSGAGSYTGASNPVSVTVSAPVTQAAAFSALPAVLRFSGSAFAAAEGGRIRVTVERTGGTTAPVAVNYQTANGSASDRSDYTATIGTLRLAAGEISRTLDVLVTDDRFAEASENLTLSLSDPVGASLGTPATATLTITDNDAVNGLSPVRWDASFDTQFFVRQHYYDFLNREPDSVGLNHWTNEINSCGTNAACRDVKRINVSAAFFLSIEFQETGYLVYRAYKAAYGNIAPDKPAPLRMREFLADTQEIGRGVVVGTPGWPEQLELNKRLYFEALVASARFAASYPASMTAAQFVDKLNANAGGVLSQSQRSDLINELLTGGNSQQARAGVVRKVAEDADLARNESNSAFVLMQYFGYLRRDPDAAPDLNFGGHTFWLGKLNQFNGDFIQAEMVKAFLLSLEYQRRFGQ